MATVSIQNLTKSRIPLPRRVFSLLVESILPGWEVSLVFVTLSRAQKLNTTLRKKQYVPNVLSYSVGKQHAEIIICPSIAKKESSLHQMSEREYLLYLFIHGALHAKGWRHSAKMETWEKKLLKRYGAAHSYWR